MIPNCASIQKEKYTCGYTGNPCVGRTWDGTEGEYDVMDREMALCPLYSTKAPSNEGDCLILRFRNEEVELPENICRVIALTTQKDSGN